MSGSALAWIAAAMLAAEPLGLVAPMAEDSSLVMQLCGGGQITIPLSKGGQQERSPHCPSSKACHAGNCRSRFDLGQ
ncbi:MAG: hypothetical protein AAGL68_00155 [Pseudomonadota bacterium]